MRFRNIAVAVVLAAGATLPLAGIANAQPDRDCSDFASQADAQAALDSQVGDPERLDADDDGIACETQFGERPAPRRPRATTPSPTEAPAPVRCAPCPRAGSTPETVPLRLTRSPHLPSSPWSDWALLPPPPWRPGGADASPADACTTAPTPPPPPRHPHRLAGVVAVTLGSLPAAPFPRRSTSEHRTKPGRGDGHVRTESGGRLCSPPPSPPGCASGNSPMSCALIGPTPGPQCCGWPSPTIDGLVESQSLVVPMWSPVCQRPAAR